MVDVLTGCCCFVSIVTCSVVVSINDEMRSIWGSLCLFCGGECDGGGVGLIGCVVVVKIGL